MIEGNCRVKTVNVSMRTGMCMRTRMRIVAIKALSAE